METIINFPKSNPPVGLILPANSASLRSLVLRTRITECIWLRAALSAQISSFQLETSDTLNSLGEIVRWQEKMLVAPPLSEIKC